MKLIDTNSDLTCVWRTNSKCGEGPLWDEREKALYWVDIDGQKAYRYIPKNQKKDVWNLPEKTGWLLRRKYNSGFVAGCQSGIYFIDLNSKTFSLALDIESNQPRNRLNDAKCDIHGRIWAGTVDDYEEEKNGWLYCIESDLSFSRTDGPYIVTNGPAISPDDSTLYHVDSYGRQVLAFDKDGSHLSNKRLFTILDLEAGYPDGLTVDEDGFVWLAHWGGWRITRFAPDGTVDSILPLPVPQVTSCTFGGEAMKTLYITTASRGLDLTQHPLAGGLFSVNVPFRGIPSATFGD